MSYGDFKDLNRITAYDEIFCDKTFNIAKYPKYDGHESTLASIVYKFLINKLLVVLLKMIICQTTN